MPISDVYFCAMSYQNLRIVFMGTPEFAVASLDALVQAGCQIVGVVTAPDKPAGRGLKLQQSAVKQYAESKGLTVLQPVKLKDPAFAADLQQLKADLQIVVAFRMLPEVIWNMPALGTINVHGSLLPQYRGAAPINWAVINGEKETGVTTFKLKHEIDTGNILQQASMPIGEDETAGEIHDRMKELGAQLLVNTVKALASGELTEQDQAVVAANESLVLQHAPKIFTETCVIHWEKPATEIHNQIRGLSPYPGAFTHLNDKTLKIYRSRKEIASTGKAVGVPESDGKTYLRYTCADGYIYVLDLQLEGKKRMVVEDFLRGYRFS